MRLLTTLRSFAYANRSARGALLSRGLVRNQDLGVGVDCAPNCCGIAVPWITAARSRILTVRPLRNPAGFVQPFGCLWGRLGGRRYDENLHRQPD
jgi:hypothetical protein